MKKFLFITIVVALTFTGCATEQSPVDVENDPVAAPEETPQEEVAFVKPLINFPQDGDSIEGPIVTISGKTTPGYRVVAHNNYTEELMECVSTQGINANSTANENGDFEFDLVGVCDRDMEVFVSAINLEANDISDCIEEKDMSESINFNVTGELHGVCFM